MSNLNKVNGRIEKSSEESKGLITNKKKNLCSKQDNLNLNDLTEEKDEEMDFYSKIKNYKKKLQKNINDGKKGVVTKEILTLITDMSKKIVPDNTKRVKTFLDQEILLKPVDVKKKKPANSINCARSRRGSKSENNKSIDKSLDIQNSKKNEETEDLDNLLKTNNRNTVNNSIVKLKSEISQINSNVVIDPTAKILTKSEKRNHKFYDAQQKKELKKNFKIEYEIHKKVANKFKDIKEKPSISKNSEKIVKKMNISYIPLYQRTQEIIAKKNFRMSNLKSHFNDLYNHEIGIYKRRSLNKTCSADLLEFENWRRKNIEFYEKKYENYEKLKLEKFYQEQMEIENTHSFVPTINKNSEMIVKFTNEKRDVKSVSSRLFSESKKKKEIINKIVKSIEPSFNPTLNSNKYPKLIKKLSKSRSTPSFQLTKNISKRSKIKLLKKNNSNSKNDGKIKKDVKKEKDCWKNLLDSVNNSINLEVKNFFPLNQSLYNFKIQDISGKEIESNIYFDQKHSEILNDLANKFSSVKKSKRLSLINNNISHSDIPTQSKLMTEEKRNSIMSE